MACHSRMVVIIGRNRRSVPSRKSPRYAIRSTSEARQILVYLRTAATGPRGERKGPACASGRGRRGVGVGAASASGGVMGLATLLEDARDHLFERRLLHADVGHGVAVQDHSQDLGHPRALDLQV